MISPSMCLLINIQSSDISQSSEELSKKKLEVILILQTSVNISYGNQGAYFIKSNFPALAKSLKAGFMKEH